MPPEWSNHDRTRAPHRLGQPSPARRGHPGDAVHHRPECRAVGLPAIGHGDRLCDVADDGIGTAAAGVQVGVVDADRPASAAGLGIVHRGELAGGEHVKVGVQATLPSRPGVPSGARPLPGFTVVPQSPPTRSPGSCLAARPARPTSHPSAAHVQIWLAPVRVRRLGCDPGS
jgi:hypothetical protein